MAVKIVTSNGQTVQSFEDWKNGGKSGGNQQSGTSGGYQVVNSSGQSLQSFEEWRNSQQSYQPSGITPGGSSTNLRNQWLKKYQNQGYDALASALSGLEDGEEKDWLSSYADTVKKKEWKALVDSKPGDWLRNSDYGLKAYQQDRETASYDKQLQNWINQMAEAPLRDSNPQYYQMVQQYRDDTSYKDMNDRWSEEQRRDFGYLYAQDKKKGEEYAIAVNEQLNAQAKAQQRQAVQEKATSGVKSGLKETGKAIAAGMLGIGEYMSDVAEYTARGRITEKGDRLSPVEYSNAVTGGISQHLNEKFGTIDDDVFILGGKGLGDVYGLGTSVAQSMASGHLLGGTGTMLAFFGNAAASGIDDAKQRGATDEQAIALGTLQGVAEGIAEKIGVDNLFKRGATNTIRGFLKNAFAQAGSEGIEEGLTSLFNNISENIVMGKNSIFYDRVNGYMENGMDDRSARKQAWLDCVEDILFDSISGAASGGISGSIETGIQNVINPVENATEVPGNATVKESLTTELANSEEEAVTDKNLATGEESSEVGAENATTTADAATGKNPLQVSQGTKVESIVKENADKDENSSVKVGVSKMETVQQTADIESFAQQFGTQANRVRRNYLEGQLKHEPENLQEYQVGFMAAYTIGWNGGKVESLSKHVPYLSQSQREIAFRLGRDAAAAQKAAEPKKAAVTAKMTTEEGTQDVTIAEVVGMDDTTMTFRLEDGRTVTDDDLTFSKSQQVLSTVWELGIDVKYANAILTESAANTAEDAAQAAGIEEAYRYGAHGYSMQQLVERGLDAGVLTNGQRQAAWNAGQISRQQAAVAAPKTAVSVPGKGAGIYFDAGSGNVTAISEETMKSLTRKRKAGVQAAVVLQKLGIGQSYHFFESYVNESGDRVYKDANGVERAAPNGWYDKSDGSIHIDLNAGATGEGLTLYTLSHELTHFVEQWSKPKYQALADFLVEGYAKGASVDELVMTKQAELSESRGAEVSYEEAYSEFIADSMEAMLADGNVLEKLTELKAKDKSLFDKIREFFDNLAKKIREIYKELTPDSAEGKAVLEMKDQIEQIQQLFAEALADAGENFQTADGQKNTAQEGRQFSERKKTDVPQQVEQKTQLEDKYYARQIDKWDGKDHGGSFRVGKVSDPLLKIGIPDVDIWFDQSKAAKQLDGKAEVTKDVLKRIPYLLEHPIAISESYDNTVMVFGEMYDENGNPIVVALRVNSTNRRNHITLVNKIRSVGTRTHNLDKLLSDDAILYLNETKKETNRWFNALGRSTPFGGTKFGLIRSISFDVEKSNILQNNSPDNSHVQRQDRSTGTSNRALLAGAFEELVTSPDELQFLREYQENVAHLNEQESKLQELRGQIRDISFGKGQRDVKKLKQLQEEATKTANRIDIYDKKLLKLERAKPLRDVLDREREKVWKQTQKKGQEAMENYREQRKESAARKEARRKIRKTIMELDKLLNRGDKKKNVKDGMTAMVGKSLKLAEALFVDEYSNRDILRNGVGVSFRGEEQKLFEETQELLRKIESGAALNGMEFASEIEAMEYLKKLDRQLSSKMSRLKDVFTDERQRLYGTTVSELLGQLADEYSRLSEAEDGAIRAAKDENVYAHLLQLQKDVGGVTVRDMTLSQMEMVADAYTMVLTTVRNANKMFAKNLKFKRDTLAGMVMGEIGAAAKKISKLVSPGKDAADRFSWNNLKPVYAFERLGSETLKTLFGNIRKGQDVWAVDMQEADTFRREQYRKHDRKNWDMEKQYSFEFESGKVDLSLEQIMSLYAYSRREAALDHLLKGGFVFGGSTEVLVKKNGIKRRYLKKDATAYNLTADELMQVIDALSAEQKAFVQEMQTYLSDVMGGKGNEVSLQMYGIKSFGEKNYFPLRSAGQYMEKAKEDSFRKEQGQISIVNSGFTKATTPHASNPITLDGFMDVWAEHVNDMAMYHGFVLPMEDFRRVYNYSTPNVEEGNSQSVNAAIENAFGKAATGYIDQLYKDLNGGAVSDNRENLGKKLVGLHKKAAVFASASVVIQQPSAFVRAFALVDPRHFIGPKVNRQRHKQLWAELKQYAPVAFVKEMGYFDTGMGKSAKDFLQAEEYSGIREKMAALFADADYRDEVLGKAPALADEYTWCMIWEAVKRETKVRNPGMDTKSNAFLQIAGERFAEVIDKTQVYDSVLSRSANMRSRVEYMNMLTSFMAEPTTSINMLEDALRKGDRKQIKRTVGAVYGSVLLNSLLVSLVYAARDDDEDETYWEKYLSSVAVEVLDGINPITYYPFLRDIWSIGQGYDVERADMSLITDFANAAKNVISAGQKAQEAAEGEEAAAMEKFKGSLWGLCDSVASLTGLPMKNIRRDIEGARSMYQTISKDLAGRKTTDLSLQDAVLADVMNAIPIGNLLYSKSKRDQLYGALVAGDATYVQRLRAGYESDAAYHSAIKLALRDNDSRIWEAAAAWNAGDMETYIHIAKEIRGENRFDQDDIVLAIRAEANSMLEKDGSSASTVKGYFTNEKFGVAMGQNNVSMADTIRKDLIDTAVANGKTRDEAEESVRSTARTQLKQLYANGTITGVNAEKMLVKYGGYDQKDAADKVAEWKYEKDFPELDGRITYTQYKRWETDGKSRGIGLDTFTDVVEYRGGNTSAGVRSQEDVAAYINRMPISTAQKDALWCCFWSESTLYKNAPWH